MPVSKCDHTTTWGRRRYLIVIAAIRTSGIPRTAIMLKDISNERSNGTWRNLKAVAGVMRMTGILKS